MMVLFVLLLEIHTTTSVLLLVDDDSTDDDGDDSNNFHMAFNYWFHPPDGTTFDKPYTSNFWKRDWIDRISSSLSSSNLKSK